MPLSHPTCDKVNSIFDDLVQSGLGPPLILRPMRELEAVFTTLGHYIEYCIKCRQILHCLTQY